MLIDALKLAIEEAQSEKIDERYNTGLKSRSGVYYAGSLGDAYMAGRRSALNWFQVVFEEYKKMELENKQ